MPHLAPSLSPFQVWLSSQPPGTSAALRYAKVASSATLSRLANDPEFRVSYRLAVRISLATGGAVPISDLMPEACL